MHLLLRTFHIIGFDNENISDNAWFCNSYYSIKSTPRVDSDLITVFQDRTKRIYLCNHSQGNLIFINEEYMNRMVHNS